jgi:hypothetical protein
MASSGTCTNDTITITTPSGVKKTRDANASSCDFNAFTRNDCSHAYELYKSWGYQGGKGLTYGDLMTWAMTSDAGFSRAL